ncbi:MAG TPA: tetratricopeptide repeat protein [Thermoleophilaceae bacterium]|nr:tetratricopeptide repeat protein [Thermoleophilaceae bacterium]
MEASPTPAAIDVSDADFDRLVVERSHELPVVVDFWAEWCAPCRALGPVLERGAAARAGRMELAKVDIDANNGVAARYQIQGIPAVKAFRDGKVASEFTGALPPAEVERFLNALVPSEAEELAAAAAASGDEQGLRRALDLDPDQVEAATALARLLLSRGEPAEALGVVNPLAGQDFVAGGLAARAQLELDDDAPSEAFAAWDVGELERALELLQEAVAATSDPDRRDLLRRVMVGMFTELGPDSELARRQRRRLATALG